MTYSYQGQEYVEQYMIEYKREDDKHWIKYRDRRGESVSITAIIYGESFVIQILFISRFSTETLTHI